MFQNLYFPFQRLFTCQWHWNKLKDKPNKYTTNENGNDRKGELTYRYHKSPEQTSNLPSNLWVLPEQTNTNTQPNIPAKTQRTPATYENPPKYTSENPANPATCENKIDIGNKLMMIKKESRMEEAAEKIPP